MKTIFVLILQKAPLLMDGNVITFKTRSTITPKMGVAIALLKQGHLCKKNDCKEKTTFQINNLNYI